MQAYFSVPTSSRLKLSMVAVALASVALTFACGGTTSGSLPATPDAPAQAGSGGAPASNGGSGGSLAGPLQESAAGASTVQPLCDAAIDAAALRGCRTPSEPGCQSCFMDFGDGTCSLFTGNLARGDWAYNFVGQVACDSDLPRCASCTRGEEFQLCNTVDRPECDCSVVDLIDPCFTPEGCDCFCVTSARLACPRPH